MCIEVQKKWHEMTEEDARNAVAQLCPQMPIKGNIQTIMDKARAMGVKVTEGYSKTNRRCVMFQREGV